MLARLKAMLEKAGTPALKPDTELLEGIAAACVLVGASDGDFDDDEATTALDRLLNHDMISAAFTSSQIEAAFDKQAARAKQGMSGRLGLKREIEEVKSHCSDSDAEMLLVIAIDVALTDGDISPAERKALDTVGKAVGLSVERYLE